MSVPPRPSRLAFLYRRRPTSNRPLSRLGQVVVRQRRGRLLSIEDLERRRLLTATLSIPLTDTQMAHVSALQAECNTVGQRVAYYEDFEQGFGNYTVDNSGGTLPGLWHHSLGRREDGLPNHSPNANFYYGLFETAQGFGQYDTLPFDHQGVLISPAITLPLGTNTLSFNSFLATRLPTDVDFVDVSVVDLDTPGSAPIVLLSRESGMLDMTTPIWSAECATLPSELSGRNVQLRFRFDTGDAVNIDPEGWYVDDILITNKPPTADLSLTKTITDTTPNEDQAIIYQITVTNAVASPDAATGVIVTDTLPTEVTFDFENVVLSEGTFDSTTGIWSGLELIPGESQTLTISGVVNAGTTGVTFENIASVTSGEHDPDSSNNEVRTSATVNRVDLSAVKSTPDMTPTVGEAFTFDIVVANAADSNAVATGVTLVDVLPVGLTFVSASDGGDYDDTTRTITWDLPNLAAGNSESRSVVVIADTGTAAQPLDNLARGTANETDPNPTNNESTETVTPVPPPSADLSIEKSVDNPAPVEGTQVTYTLVATNSATSTASATGVTVIDVLPVGVTFRSVSPEDGTYDPVTAVWTIGDLPQGASRTLALTVSINAETEGTTLSNTAVIDGEQPDPDDTNNLDTATTSPVPIPTQTVQFISPLGVFRQVSFELDAPLPMPTPPSGQGAIVGFAWTDADLDGEWDAGETARSGFPFFLDLNKNGQFDPQIDPEDGIDGDPEPFAFSDPNGKYVFNDLDPGQYVVREDKVIEETVLFSFPADGGHSVEVAAGQVTMGTAGVAESPNFGALQISTYVRPANQFIEFADDYPQLIPALARWQSVQVENTTGVDFDLNEVVISALFEDPVDGTVDAAEFLSVKQIDDAGNVVDAAFPITINEGMTSTFLLFYDPAIRQGNNRVVHQYPDWFGDGPLTEPHRFAENDRLELVADNGLRFPVKLVGGSTFDSDITHNGRVDVADFALLDNLLLVQLPIVKPVLGSGGSVRFDPTADVNARCPNGTDQVTGTCSFPIDGTPQRELSLGDFGPMNVELKGFIESGVGRQRETLIEIRPEFLIPPSAAAASMIMAIGSGAGEPILALTTASQALMNEVTCQANLSDPMRIEKVNPEIVSTERSMGPIQEISDESGSAGSDVDGELHWCDPGPLGKNDSDDDDDRLRLVDEYFGNLV